MWCSLGKLFVAVGILFLVWSVWPAWRIVRELAGTPSRRYWVLQTALAACFALGYAAFLAAAPWDSEDWHLPLVSVIFLLGASYVMGSHQIGLQTVKDARRLALLEVEASTDPLTTLRNRRYLDRRLVEEHGRARRYGLPLSLLMMDVDHFKRVNDELGHQVGDRVLAALGRLVTSRTRLTDVAARYGGEELLVLATNTGLEGALVLAERLRATVEAFGFVEAADSPSGRPVRCTVSVGVAELSPGMETPESLLRAADQALYRAKREGRNRVVAHAGAEAGG